MERTLGKEYPAGMPRTNYLKDNCDVVVEMGYSRKFSDDELSEMKTELAEAAILINNIESEKKMQMEIFKERLKSPLKKYSELLDDIEKRSHWVKENCYKFVYEDERIAAFYNADGDLVESRPLSGDELQRSIFPEIKRTGTEG